MMDRCKQWLAALSFLWFPIWSRMYQRIRKETQRPGLFISGLTPMQAASLTHMLVWRPDGWRELWNAAHHPNYVMRAIWGHDDRLQEMVLSGDWRDAWDYMRRAIPGFYQPPGSMDCEDYALWVASVIDPAYQPKVLSVLWSTGPWPWQIAGHAVCVYRDPETGAYGHVGNWGNYRDKTWTRRNAVTANILARQGLCWTDLVAVRCYSAEDLTS